MVDREMIEALYRASQAGVKIELIVRGICCLRPGVAGVSENITVRSIVGRFLEHARVFVFENGGDPQVYVGSADWMPRNFFRRIETIFPIEDPALRRRLLEQILAAQLSDNVKSSILNAEGNYTRISRPKGDAAHQSQEEFMALALGEAKPRRKQRAAPSHGCGASSPEDPGLTSPCRATLTDYYPRFLAAHASAFHPAHLVATVHAETLAYVVADSTTGQVLDGSAQTKKLQMGSLTKIATAMVVYDWAAATNADLGQLATVPQSAMNLGAQPGVGFTTGDRCALRDLLYAALLQSDNAAAETLADHIGRALDGRGTPGFVKQMNALARTLGMERTSFTNPHGLDDVKPIPYSTAEDLAKLTAYAMKNPGLRFVVSQRERKISYETAGGQASYLLRNTNELLGVGGIDGVKTGQTRKAGGCVIVSSPKPPISVQQDGQVMVTPRRINVVVLGSSDRFGIANGLVQRGWQLYDQWAPPAGPPNGRQLNERTYRSPDQRWRLSGSQCRAARCRTRRANRAGKCLVSTMASRGCCLRRITRFSIQNDAPESWRSAGPFSGRRIAGISWPRSAKVRGRASRTKSSTRPKRRSSGWVSVHSFVLAATVR
jgi:D-alanyl-D-alanine carboxypeptidase